jgi:hypothetical protein
LPRYAIVVIAAIVTGVVVGAVIAGGGVSKSTTHSVPDLEPPKGSISSSDKGTSGTSGETGATGSSDQQSSSGTQTQTTTPAPSSGGSQAPSNDTQQHDVAPPKGSPAQRFEAFCKANPGAC